jgi:hypothetical protein
MFRQLLIGAVVSACNSTIHALIMVILVQIARRTNTMSASRPSLRLIAVMIATVSIGFSRLRGHRLVAGL